MKTPIAEMTRNLHPLGSLRISAYCMKGGGTLHKRYGVWVSEAAGTDDKPVSGMTVADLSRDGMLTITMLGKSASAQLTTRGSWFARTAAAESAVVMTA